MNTPNATNQTNASDNKKADPKTEAIAQYYLHINDEVHAQAATDRGRAENLNYLNNNNNNNNRQDLSPAQSNSSATTSAASSGPLQPFSFNNNKQQHLSPKSEQQPKNEIGSNASSVAVEQTGDFVHVHLEHLTSESQSQSFSQEEEEEVPAAASSKSTSKNKFAFYRKFASEGKGNSNNKNTSGGSGSGGLLQALSSSFGGSFGSGGAHDPPTSTKEIKQDAPGQKQQPAKAKHAISSNDPEPQPFQRVQAIQGTFLNSLKKNYSNTTESGDVSVSPLQSLHSMPTAESYTSNNSQGQEQSSDIGAVTNPNSSKYLQRGGGGSYPATTANPKALPVHRTQKFVDHLYSKSLTSDIGTSKEEEEESDGSYIQMQDFPNKNDTRNSKRSPSSIYELPYQDNTQHHQLSLWQTIRQNTRANFCSVFLLGVALCCLVLLVLAKLTNTTELLFYDEESDSSLVVKDNETLLTIEILAIALILVLFLGSFLYCAVATCDSNRALIKTVKHKDACLANSGPRRKHPPPGYYHEDVQRSRTISSMEEGQYYANMNDTACCSPALEPSPTYDSNPHYYVTDGPTYTSNSDTDDNKHHLSRQQQQRHNLGRPPRPSHQSAMNHKKSSYVAEGRDYDYYDEESFSDEDGSYEESDYSDNSLSSGDDDKVDKQSTSRRSRSRTWSNRFSRARTRSINNKHNNK